MKLVDRPYVKPNRCAAVPFIGQTHPNTRWIDTGAEMDGFDNHVYLSEPAVREAAKLLGFPDPGQYSAALEVIDTQKDEIHGLKAELDELQRTLKAIDIVKAAGLKVTKE